MISDDNKTSRYCSEPLENIENYDKAIADDEHVWDCHHRAEILPCGRYTAAQLQKHGLYWHRPASELIFLRHDEHRRIHHAGVPLAESHKRKISEGMKKNGRCLNVEMTRLSDGFTQTFPSQRDAVRWLKHNGFPKANHTGIIHCLRGTVSHAYGAKWRHANELV